MKKPTYIHNDQLLKELQPKVQKASELIINSIFQKTDPTKGFKTEDLKEQFQELILTSEVRNRFPKDLEDKDILNEIANKRVYDKGYIDRAFHNLSNIMDLAKFARDLDFFFKNRYFK